jgi:hypothetical protein
VSERTDYLSFGMRGVKAPDMLLDRSQEKEFIRIFLGFIYRLFLENDKSLPLLQRNGVVWGTARRITHVVLI